LSQGYQKTEGLASSQRLISVLENASEVNRKVSELRSQSKLNPRLCLKLFWNTHVWLVG
jgi:hypothetical protein